MPAENLTRAEAIERKSIVEIQSYEVELDLTTGPETFRSRTVARFTANPGASTLKGVATAVGGVTSSVGNLLTSLDPQCGDASASPTS